MKKLLIILFILSSFNSKGTIHQIGVWGGYYQFVPASITMQLGDTLQWEPYFGMLPTMLHTITSDNIPVGAAPFDQVWQMPADTFFQYIPQVAGLYQYVCTPHIPNGMIGEFTVTNGSNTQTYVPDDNFEAYLEANAMGNGIPFDDYVTTSNINTVTTLNVNNQSIADLTGVEDFTNLIELGCGDNTLTSIDISNNLALNSFGCYNNQLTALDVSNNTEIDSLNCAGNHLTMLDLYSNTELTFLVCFNNQLTSLDVSNNTALTELHCSHNQLTILDVRNGNNSNATNFISGYNPNLTCINVDDSVWSTANWTFANGNIDLQHYFSNNCSEPSSIQEHSTNKELINITDILGRETKGTKNKPLLHIYDDGTIEKIIIIE